MPSEYDGRRVLIRWIDSSGSTGWELAGIEPLPFPLEVETVAWMLREEASYVVVSSSISDRGGESEQCRSPIAIPRCAILDMEFL